MNAIITGLGFSTEDMGLGHENLNPNSLTSNRVTKLKLDRLGYSNQRPHVS